VLGETLFNNNLIAHRALDKGCLYLQVDGY
jgi:hypothetical protein